MISVKKYTLSPFHYNEKIMVRDIYHEIMLKMEYCLFTINGQNVTVCETLHLNTSSIREQFVKTVKRVNTGLIVSDKRERRTPIKKNNTSV